MNLQVTVSFEQNKYGVARLRSHGDLIINMKCAWKRIQTHLSTFMEVLKQHKASQASNEKIRHLPLPRHHRHLRCLLCLGSALKSAFTERALSNCLRSQRSPPPRASKCPLTAAAKIVTNHQSKIYHQSNCVARSQDTRERTRLTIMDKSKCSVCFRNILSHACPLTCCVCKYDVHLNCIPFVDKKDSIYMEREHNQWFCIKCIEDILPFNHCNDDDDFHEYLSDYWHVKPMTSANNANDKLFVPFELSSDPQCPLYGHDPYFQIYNDLCKDTSQKCEYFNECSFNRMCDKSK